MKEGFVIALSKSATHSMSKINTNEIRLLKGVGVEGDAHAGKNVKHRSRVAKDPTQPNLRQVHLIHSELLEELSLKGFNVRPGEMGENITTKGIDLLMLPKDTILKIGDDSRITITGLRNPCGQLDGIQNGLMRALIDRDSAGQLVRKAGIMGVVLSGGCIKVADKIEVILPAEKPFIKLNRV